MLPNRADFLFAVLNENLKMNVPATPIFWDVGKAFDKVWHMDLTYKLIQLGIDARIRNKNLRIILNGDRYLINSIIHSDLCTTSVKEKELTN